LHNIAEMLPNVPENTSINKNNKNGKTPNPTVNQNTYGQTASNGFEMPFTYFTPRDAIKLQSKQGANAGIKNYARKQTSLNYSSHNPTMNIKIKPRAIPSNEHTGIGFFPDQSKRQANPMNSS
jgi:hypothetical protein